MVGRHLDFLYSSFSFVEDKEGWMELTLVLGVVGQVHAATE